MKKETINTFSDGMSLDLNPLGTPNKSLTNCLNGTLITYNGNELTLQNDMGNVEVDAARLPKGYVPIGMKEHGGIIYVASYNPETKKGLLGCFPSPQLIYVSEAAQTVVEINIEDIFLVYPEKFWNDIPIIDKNEYKEEIFKDAITLEAKIFNVGDKFIIKSDKAFSNLLREAIDDNIIVIKLYIIPTNGELPIEISSCERDDLRLYEEVNSQWKKDLWIFQNDGNRYLDLNEDLSQGPILVEKPLPFETILNKYRLFLQTYPGPQGTLELVFEFNTFKLFNLYRKYYKIGADFDVLFIGEGFADDLDPCNIVNDDSLLPFALSGNINKEGHNVEQCEILSTQSDGLIASTDNYSILGSQSLCYDIMPTSKYGALKLFNNSFLKSGELTVLNILDSHNKITNWDFEVNSDDVIIKWTYTTFKGDPEINHMRFVFIPLDRVYGLAKSYIDNLYINGPRTVESANVYKINKLYYSGDFEDKVVIGENGLMSNYIYLFRLDIIYNDHVENGHDYKLLYTGTYFNDKNISDYSNNNRPQVEITCNLTTQQTYTVEKITYTVIREDDSGTPMEEFEGKKFIILTKDSVNANDVMFLANHEKYFGKIVGIIINVDCEVTSTLSIDNKNTELRPLYAGTFDAEQTLDKCAVNGRINCTILELDTFKYEGDGDEEVQKILKYYTERQCIKQNGVDVPLNGATITYIKEGNTYRNTSTITIHRGIVSKFGQEDFYTALNEGLFPVYEPDDNVYNEKLFGFKIDEDGNLSNIIGGEDFMGLSMWLAKNRNMDATTSVKDSMITIERSFNKKTALSRYDFKGAAQTPYHYGSYISEGIGIVNYGSEGTSRIEAMKQCNYAPIQIIASNEYERVWDKSYWDGDVDSRICNLMVLPHSEVGESLRGEFSVDWDKDKEKHYGYIADIIRNLYITGDKNNVGVSGRNLFKVSKGSTRSMYILWRSQYGYQLMNIATPLNIESNQELSEVIRITPQENGKLHVEQYLKEENTQYPLSETHLRADHMLLCLLSLILITKKKNSDLLLNSPDIAQMYSTIGFKTKGKLAIQGAQNPVIVLNSINIEDLLLHIINNNILNPKDNFIPKFNCVDYTNGYIDCGGKITTTTDRFGIININALFYSEGIPEFCTLLNEEQRFNVYPGKINKVLGMYLCLIELDNFGLFKINEELVDALGKFYKVFLPTIHSHTNDPEALYSCLNTDTYKQILEGFAYNDVLLPLTKIKKMQGKDVSSFNSLEDLESPFFNLLYYNSIDLNFELEDPSGFEMHGDTCTCMVPVDYCHGFAFITLFGDQSRYLDSGVYYRNVLNGLTFSGVDYNLGYTSSHKIDDDQRCYCHDIFGKDRRADKTRTLPSGSNQFILGTYDWASSPSTFTGGASYIGDVGDDEAGSVTEEKPDDTSNDEA